MPDGQKMFLVFVSLTAGFFTFLYLSTDGFYIRPAQPSMFDFVGGVAGVFVYPIVGAILFPLVRFLKAMALGHDSLDDSPQAKIEHITFWPITSLYALVVYPCLILINLLVD